jgi:hypothetical protein
MSEKSVSAFAVENSQNRKTGLVSATYASQVSCPKSCQLYDNGCYAQKGLVKFQTNRVNRSNADASETAIQEAAAIDRLSGKLDLRVHVVGDCSTNQDAAVVGSAMVRHESKHGKKAYTYTHASADVEKESWMGANVIASCDDFSEIAAAKARGYATAFVALKGTELYETFKSNGGRALVVDGQKLVGCPFECSPKKPQCVDCRLCFDSERLVQLDITIVFPQH